MIVRKTTNFKRKGRAAPKGAVLTPARPPTGNEGKHMMITQMGELVLVQGGLTLLCDGVVHAQIIAHALSDGLIGFSTNPFIKESHA